MRIWTIAIRTIVAVGLVVMLAYFAFTVKRPTSAEASVITPNNVEFIDALMRADLGPEQLAAAGFSAAEVENALADVWAYLLEHEDALENADAAVREVEVNYRALERLVYTRQATEQQESEYAAAQAAYAAAVAQQQAIINAIYNAGTAELSAEPELQVLNALRQNQPWRTPWEFLVVNREESAWVNLREALAAERYAEKHDVEIDPSAASLLAQERTIPAVAAASSNLANNLDDITLAWNNAVAPQ